MTKKHAPLHSNWRSVRAYKSTLTQHFVQRHSLRWHAFWIGLLTLLATLASSALLKAVWPDGLLSIRYALTLGLAYLVYLLLVRVWAGYMAKRSKSDSSGDIPSPDGGSPGSSQPDGCESPHDFNSGGGGDFGGGGAQGSFDAPSSEVSSALSDVTSTGLEVAASADEVAIVIVPVVVVFSALVFLLASGGWMISLLFGIDILLAVTVEIAFATVAGRTLYQIGQNDWWLTAVSLSWKPVLGSMLLAVAFGAVVDIWFPQANSLLDFWSQLRKV